MDRRHLIVTGLATLTAGPALAQNVAQSVPPPQGNTASAPSAGPYAPPASGNVATPTYSEDELVHKASDFLGVAAESVGAAFERAFKDNGRPTAYIAGEEASGAFIFGLRYGKGLLYMKDEKADPQAKSKAKSQPKATVYWQGPSVGFDAGGNGSRVFVLCYNLQYPDAIYRRFPGVDGSAYFIGGLGVNYQRADSITLAPVRAGVGLRLGANVGYLSYSRKRNIIPL